MEEPFSQDALNRIFKVGPKHPDRLITRESSDLEFKQSFSVGNLWKYARTGASFANCHGGYIVFGIMPSPHTVCDGRLDRFDKTDPEKISNFFNEHFAPELVWHAHQHEFSGMSFPILYFPESKKKPVVCTRATEEMGEGDIYYRYRGRTQRIRYPELREVLDEGREDEARMWLAHITRIAKVGVQDAGVFDLSTGLVTGRAGSFIIDEALLPQLTFIREGQFSEKAGAPAIRIIGNAEPVSKVLTGEVVRVSKGIRTPDIINAFLEDRRDDAPVEYLKQVCYETSAFLPVYHFIRRAGLSIPQAIELVDSVPSRSSAKGKLLERLRSGRSESRPLPSPRSPATDEKLAYRDSLIARIPDIELPQEMPIRMLEAVRMLKAEELDEAYVKATLKRWFIEHYEGGAPNVADGLRRAICHVDEMINRDGEQQGAER
jgi:hypothetical protein